MNLGAGTITSNLKNTYGTVQLWTPAGMRDTGASKLGSLFGDHAKTGIGMRLTTGTVIGAGANVFGAAMPPKYVPPFSWVDGESDHRISPGEVSRHRDARDVAPHRRAERARDGGSSSASHAKSRRT